MSALLAGVQVAGYRTAAGDGGPAALLVADAGAVRTESLAPGTELGFALGERRCAGTIADSEHVPCDAGDAPYCDAHADAWVCARCTGTCLKDEMDCFEDHAVYLAAFAPDVFKVGVTKAWRVGERLREQGADRGAVVREVSNGRVAREIEAGLARGEGDAGVDGGDGTPPADLTDRVGTPAKVRGIHRSVDEAGWEALLSDFDVLERYDLDYGLDLDARPVAETVAEGTVVGTKGRVLVIERVGGTYAVDLRDLVGRELSAGGTDRDLQSNLGAFG